MFADPSNPYTDTAHPLAYNGNNTYSATFYAPSTGTLQAAGYDAVTKCKTNPPAGTLPCQDKTSGSFTIKIFGAAPATPPVVKPGGTTGGSTAKLPFGTAVTIPMVAGGVIDATSPALPAGTKQVTLDGELSDAEIDKLLGSVEVQNALAAYNARHQEETILLMCLIFAPSGNLPLDRRFNSRGTKSCYSLLSQIANQTSMRSLASAKAGCTIGFVPVWKSGSHPTAQLQREAVAAVRQVLTPSCSRTGSKFSLRLSARGNTTLNQDLGRSVRTDLVRSTGVTGGSSPQLTVKWNRAGAAAGALPGHYTGTTSTSDALSFDVTSDGKSISNFKADGTCQLHGRVALDLHLRVRPDVADSAKPHVLPHLHRPADEREQLDHEPEDHVLAHRPARRLGERLGHLQREPPLLGRLRQALRLHRHLRHLDGQARLSRLVRPGSRARYERTRRCRWGRPPRRS